MTRSPEFLLLILATFGKDLQEVTAGSAPTIRSANTKAAQLSQLSERIASDELDDAVNYLKQWRPNEDSVPESFFKENAYLALQTRRLPYLPYTKDVSDELFMQYVLPYAHFDEGRDNWRPKMYAVLLPYVEGKKSLQEAAEALFPAWSSAFTKTLHFKSNMTPQVMAPLTETLALGYASCTGMSIFLADCLRAVGIPARIVGVESWNRPEKGNHTWVEVWMGDHWNFVDAVPDGNEVAWNQTWFAEQAKKQTSDPEFAIMSPLWGPQAKSLYNMSWRHPATFVPAIDVTGNYVADYNASPLAESSWGYMPACSIVFILSVMTIGGAGFAYKVNKDRSGWERIP